MECPKNSSPARYASVLVDLAIDRSLDYEIPKNLIGKIQKGTAVRVPVRGQLRQGYVTALLPDSTHASIQPVSEILPEAMRIPEDLMDLSLWMSAYYCAPPYRVLKTVLPPSVRTQMEEKRQYVVSRAQTKEKIREECIRMRPNHPGQARVLEILLTQKKAILMTELMEIAGVSKSPLLSLEIKKLVRIDKMQIDRSPLENMDYFKSAAKQLNSDQKTAYEKIAGALEKKIFETHLIFGVTGSGKTELYMQAIEKARQLGRSAIMLVPEISLTAQTIEHFRSRFEGEIAILHHRLSKGERVDEWRRIQKGHASIVIGARSALFSPMRDLGLIVVDEEHDAAYKQAEEQPCYHARDVAVMRGKLTDSVVILGSATPSFESYYNAQKGKYVLSKLANRSTAATLPKITIIDMRKKSESNSGNAIFSETLIEAMKKRVAQGEQTILFLNRRGYHSSMVCSHCGSALQCPHCDIALTFHRIDQSAACHLCNHATVPPPKCCPKCGGFELFKYRGIGTEQVERILHALLPDARTLRIDGDTTRHKGSYERFYRSFRTGKADILIGTQMIAKGLHFPMVTLAAVLNADAGLQIPDFRAAERTYQLITQVAGRSGRGLSSGEVLIQTQMSGHPTISMASRQDFESYFSEESATRALFGFPPCSHLVKVMFSGKNQQLTYAYSQKFWNQVRPIGFSLLPVVACGHGKIKDRFRFQFLIRGHSAVRIGNELKKVLNQISAHKEIKVSIDVDPVNTFF